jgi:hypothetical protein
VAAGRGTRAQGSLCAEGVEHRGQAGVEHAVENKDVDTHGNYDIKVGNLADTTKAAASLLCASRFTAT